jgi:serine/threonine protein kinase/tetratricopeptide (TPR) repeat protein
MISWKFTSFPDLVSNRMDPMEDLEQAAEQVFGEALDLKGEERKALLDRACGSQPALRKMVELLLEENDRLLGFLSEPVITPSEDPGSGISREGLPHGTRLGRYLIIDRLGKGGMGEVYVALDPALERRVAIKLLPTEVTGDKHHVRRFTQEAKAASALSHPNIVTIYGFGESEFGQYLVMELINGQRLRSLSPKPLDSSSVIAIGTQIARALEATHACGIIHRDLKPDNIMVRPDGLVKVLDFGIARLAGSTSNSTPTALTLPGTTLGTPEYMSPEQVRGEWLTCASDVFSMGTVLYELATGKHPFEADSTVGFMHSILSRQVIRPSRLNPSIPLWLESLLMRMLEKEPQTRCAAADVVQAFCEKELEHAPTVPVSATPPRRIVGRRKELAELNAALQGAAHGQSMMLCVSGEAGQGKTTLIDGFLQDVSSRPKALVAVGRCSERLAGAGAYLPVLETLESLLTGGDRESTAAVIKSIAPTWYGQLLSTSDGPPPSPSEERLKREFVALLQELSSRQPLLVFLDDVHWADASTTDLLLFTSRQMDQLRLLLVTTFRSAELYSSNHPFLQLHREMQTHRLSRELPLEFFSVADIREYLDLRFPGHSFPDELAQKLAQRTEGNPLFIADLLRYMQEQEAIMIREGCWSLAGPLTSLLNGMPDTVRSMVQRTMGQLEEDERKLLAAASVQGNDFDSAVLAQAIAMDAVELEDKLEKLERKSGFLRPIDEHELPDRTLTLRYRFVHVLYHDHLYESVRPARRALLSKAIGRALQHFYGSQSERIAAQLAALFDAAREFESSAAFYQTAAQNALRLFAGTEAEALARRGLVVVQGVTETPERSRLELALHGSLALALRNQKTHASTEALESHRRVKELSQECGDQRGSLFAQLGMFWSALSSCDFSGARERTNECLCIAERMGDPAVLMQTRFLIGYSLFHRAEHPGAEQNLQEAVSLYDEARDARLVETFGLDVRANGLAILALSCWYRGFPDEAQRRMREAVVLARAGQHPVPLSVVLVSHAMLCDLLDDPRSMKTAAEEVIEIANKHGLQKNTLFWGKFALGWSMTRLGEPAGGCALMREAINEAETIRMSLALPLFGLGLASALFENGQSEEAAAAIELYISQAERSGPCERLAEMYRVKGEILLRSGVVEPGEEFLVRALNTARRFGQRSSELRAAMSLGTLHHQRGQREAARSLLSDVYSAFTEGFDTPDLMRAKSLIGSFGEVNAHVAPF